MKNNYDEYLYNQKIAVPKAIDNQDDHFPNE